MKSPAVLTIGTQRLPADLSWVDGAQGIVVFAHGSGSGRASPRNRWVAARLNEAGFATVLFDLLTPLEAADRHKVFDVGLLGRRMVEAIDAVRAWPTVRELPIGLFGASTGAAAALIAAAARPADVCAVVSRGGRPDLALDVLPQVKAPTLLIVGSADEAVVGLNERALAALEGEKRLALVAGATHLFEEPGALAQVVALAVDWFARHPGGPKP